MLLPEGLTARPATSDDAQAVWRLTAAAMTVDVGEPMLDLDDIVSDWTSPNLDLAFDTVLVNCGDEPVAFIQVEGERADGDVHPAWRGRGLGLTLVEWSERRALERGRGDDEVHIGQTVIKGLPGSEELFAARGYRRRWDSWVLRLPDDVALDQPHPRSATIRGYVADDEQYVYRVVEAAFGEWDDRSARTFEQWQATSTAREVFDPTLVAVATVDDRIVGACVGIPYAEEGWIDQLAVDSDMRGRGIGRALVARVFGEFRRRGETKLGLNTDSRTGALGLYVDLGMVVEHTFIRWSTRLR